MIALPTLTRQLLHILLPADCASCGTALTGDPVPFFCTSCWERIRPLQAPCCPRCGRPFASKITLRYSPRHLCHECRRCKPAYTRAHSLYAYDGVLQDAIRLYKYGGKVSLGRFLFRLMKEAWRDVEAADVMMPVPLHASRLREREFNQALLLADRLSRWSRTPLSYDNLTRIRPTQAQTSLSRTKRRKNLRNSFRVQRPREVRDRTVLLVDDVFTTGTTVNECAKALRKAGSGHVYVVTLARTI